MIKLKKRFNGSKRWFWITLYVAYILFILISATAYYAEQSVNTRASGNYNYVLTFDDDGKQEHYIVKLASGAEQGTIWVNYNSNNHNLDVKTQGISELTIDCRSIAEEKTKEILGVNYKDDENYYKQYFVSKDKFSVSVNAENKIDLVFKDVPYPSKVIVNEKTLVEGTGKDYTYSNGQIDTTAQKGNSNVMIYFKDEGGNDLNAYFKTGNKDFYHIPKEDINFDASESTGNIEDYIWDFGDGKFGHGVKVQHSYSLEDNYKVTLVVRDDNKLTKRVTNTLSVYDKDNDNLPDAWELKYNLNNPYGDEDQDGLLNKDEHKYNTNPKEADTDGDGFSDNAEVLAGTDPLDSTSIPREKEQKEEVTPSWIFFMSVGIVIVVIMLIFIYTGYLQKAQEKEKMPATKKAKKTVTSIQTIKRRGTGVPTFPRKSASYLASKIPEEVLKPERKPLEPPEKPPNKPPSFGTQQGKEKNIGMFDDDLKLPKGSVIRYECPTCESALGKEDEFCQVCGEQFED